MPTVTINKYVPTSEVLEDLRHVLADETDAQIKAEFRAVIAKLEAEPILAKPVAGQDCVGA